jgi:hypothetical protein
MPFTGNFLCTSFKLGLLGASFDFATPTTDVYKIALYDNAAAFDASTTAYTTNNEVVASGYTAGGEILTPTVSYDGTTSFLSFANVSWTSALTARGALIYKVGGSSICVLDFGSNKTSTTTFTVEFPAASSTTAIIRLA